MSAPCQSSIATIIEVAVWRFEDKNIIRSREQRRRAPNEGQTHPRKCANHKHAVLGYQASSIACGRRLFKIYGCRVPRADALAKQTPPQDELKRAHSSGGVGQARPPRGNSNRHVAVTCCEPFIISIYPWQVSPFSCPGPRNDVRTRRGHSARKNRLILTAAAWRGAKGTAADSPSRSRRGYPLSKRGARPRQRHNIKTYVFQPRGGGGA